MPKRDALALHVRGWSWGSHHHLMQTQLFPNTSNGEAKARKWVEVPKTSKEEKEEEEEEEEEEITWCRSNIRTYCVHSIPFYRNHFLWVI